jgi:lysophospholipase L1-like esterase
VAQARAAQGARFPQTAYVAPTLALSAAGAATSITNGVTFFPYDKASSPTRLFPYFGFAGGKLVQATYTLTGRDWVKAPVSNLNVLSAPLAAEFYIDSADFEILHIGQGARFAVYVDNVRALHTHGSSRTGTAQAGGATTITLDAGASATTGVYVGFDVAITGGPGSGQQKLITAYDGTTKVATVVSAWSTNPEVTSTFEIRPPGQPFAMPGNTGSLYRVRVTFATRAVRRIRVETNGYFPGVTAGPTDMLYAAPAASGQVCMVLGDSYTTPTGSIGSNTGWASIFCSELGFHPVILGVTQTGYLNPGAAGSAKFQDRFTPDANSFWYDNNTSTGGTYTISVTAGGSTQTTGALVYNASIATIQAALEGLSNVGSGNVEVLGPWTARYIVLFRNALATANLTFSTNGALLTGGASTTMNGGAWQGDIAYHLPRDGEGNVVPFYIVIAGGYNDTPTQNAAYTPEALDAAATDFIARLQSRFPQATIIMVGPWTPSSTISPYITNAEAVLSSVADDLPLINQTKPYVNVLPFITGTGRVGAETGTGSADRYISNDGTHPSEAGHKAIGQFVAGEFGRILGFQVSVMSRWIGGA